MGQKINPLGFRLGTTQSHHSLWFAQPKNYSKGLQEDQKIRNCIKNFVKKKYKNIFWRRGNCTYRDSKTNRCDSSHNIYGIPKIINRKKTETNRRITDTCTKRTELWKPKTQYCYHKNFKSLKEPKYSRRIYSWTIKEKSFFSKSNEKSYRINRTGGYKRNSSTNCGTSGWKRNCTSRMDSRREGSSTNHSSKNGLLFVYSKNYLWGIRHKNLDIYRQE
uniref:Ribosomal protein S3 n=1 Tax=Euphorbia smithii TaxID=1138367 RepID=A0A6M3RJ37_9ROSI|nr:ribosomal protein S3 [Euphorbia smithii]